MRKVIQEIKIKGILLGQQDFRDITEISKMENLADLRALKPKSSPKASKIESNLEATDSINIDKIKGIPSH